MILRFEADVFYFMDLINSERIENKPRQILRSLWGWGVPSLVLIVLVYQLYGHADLSVTVWTSMQSKWLGLALLLLPLNIYMESYKWQYIMRRYASRSIWEVCKLILSGRSLNVFTPFGVGDAFARLADVDLKVRDRAIAALLGARITQMVPTLMLGSVSVLWMFAAGLDLSSLLHYIYVLGGVVAVLSVLFWFCATHIHRVRQQYRLSFSSLSSRQWGVMLLLSLGRYMVFTLQFCLVFYAVGLRLPLYQLILGVFWIFFFKTVVPNLTILGDLMKRELSAVLFFSLLTDEWVAVSLASAWVWVINIVLPAVGGVFFVSKTADRLV
ncbi:hypothetical protein BFP72_12480 [Reichenbachiella sp. 5M10]|uniref:lysylphosphatidylglycerol synthase domain-containing protein n=1 Tax=Reichenbachiella sp. 5M10 TaxID=1889772 RepID=UPI000C15EC05|nr:lysylphosphatidylglycerol synthase domain-containing protein [Reichenbachiella sp. 5M10]PIB36152.1 hypothetical protein BFP72_12480 [Reichenbachiella sp. 5M10]